VDLSNLCRAARSGDGCGPADEADGRLFVPGSPVQRAPRRFGRRAAELLEVERHAEILALIAQRADRRERIGLWPPAGSAAGKTAIVGLRSAAIARRDEPAVGCASRFA